MDKAPLNTPLTTWLEARQELVARLSGELHAALQAVAEFHARNYLDSIERQESLAAQLAAHDARLPELPADAPARRRLADAVRTMNLALRRLNDIHASLIDLGSRSARCFQRVWALREAGYALPRDPAGAPAPLAALGARIPGKER